jgi:hypothetical protein
MNNNKVFIAYIPGMDTRNLSKGWTPFISECLKNYAWSKIFTNPSNEVLSTLITGMNPHEHGIWQLKTKESLDSVREEKLTDKIPDIFTVAIQAFRHQFFHDCDVPTIPPRRRRAFELRRVKFRGRANTSDLLQQLGNVPSILNSMDQGNIIYSFSDRLNDQQTLVSNVANGDAKLEFLQFHALDMLGHWQLNTEEKLEDVYSQVDSFLRNLYEKCESKGIRMAIVSDHGQEKVIGDINIKKKINQIDVPQNEFNYYIQPMQARFWFHSNRAREQILKALKEVTPGNILHFEDLHKFNIDFKSPDYGEVYFIPEPGYLLFPHDFYHPLVNLVFGVKDPQQRNRILNPKHVAYHGYLPHHDSEKGLLLLTDNLSKLNQTEINAADIAPTLLNMVDQAKPDFMSGISRLIA